MAGVIDDAAAALRAEAPVFTRRNLYFAARRARGAATSEATFDAALRRRLRSGPLPGLLPARSERRSPRLPRGWDAEPPRAVLLVDRPAIADLFAALVPREERLAVVGIDGSPSPVVAWLVRGFQADLRAPVLFLHDAATVIYPFAVEPLATRVRQEGGEPLVYRDLGLPPLGATGRRFGDPTLQGDEAILELEAIPPAALVRYCLRSVAVLLT